MKVNTAGSVAAAGSHREKQERIGDWLRVVLVHIADTLYGGGPIPATEGHVFRELSERCGWEEGKVAGIGRELNLWPWGPYDVGRAYGKLHGIQEEEPPT